MKNVLFILFLIPSLLLSQNIIDESVYQKALDLLDKTISIDSHSDTPLRLRDSLFNLAIRNDRGCFDFVRMKEGKLSAEFFAVFTSNSEDKNNPSRKALEILQRIYIAIEKNTKIAEIAKTSLEVEHLFAEGKKIICLGMENGGPLENDLGNLKMFYNLGIRYITLTHSGNNQISDSAGDTLKLWHGLSPFGKKLIPEMNKLGIMIDVSHISDESFWDVIKLSKSPIIASHSCCRAICNSPRNLTDEMIKALASNGGVLQLNFYPGYLSPEYEKKSSEISKQLKPLVDSIRITYKGDQESYYKELQKLRQKYPNTAIPDVSILIDHIDHVVKLVGVDYVGIGSDFDGLSTFPRGLEDVSKLPVITYHLLKRGYSENDIRKIVGGNFLRVWKNVERLAEKTN